MNILIFDQDYHNNHVDYIQPLVDNINDLSASILDNLETAKQSFDNNSYDFVVVDFTADEGKEFLAYLLEHTPKQKIITLSYDLVSSQEDCSECEQNFNKRRLIKPIDAYDIYQTIKTFDITGCKYMNHFSNPSVLIDDFINRYDYFTYDSQTHIIERIDKHNEHVLSEYVDILENLKKYEIDHDVIDEYVIKIVQE